MKASDEKIWQPTVVQNLVRYAPSGTYFARLRVGGETCLEKFENRDVFRRETTIARHTARSPFEDRIVDRVCRREDDGRQCCGCLPAENTREHITQAEIKRIP
ncbi:MAG: hypothetical protein DMF05_00465 [Verrucomicrobia bacterium]|nr:MAG: hypothetical protein DMF05_00465 [Verrucomicrobiota bacterium]